MNENPATLFSTSRLQLAAFLLTDGRLEFQGCKPLDRSRCEFLFQDKDNIGSRLELEFDQGGSCTAQSLFASYKFLRTESDQELGRRVRTNERYE